MSVEPDDFLYLPAPSKLGDASALSPGLVQVVARDFLNLVPVRVTAHLQQQLHAIGNALAAPFAGLAPAAVPTGLNEKQEHYDSHFRVIRADGDAANLLVAATIAAFCKFFQDQQQGTSLLPLEVAHLFAAAQLIVGLFSGNGG
jgi:hypothetical protein